MARTESAGAPLRLGGHVASVLLVTYFLLAAAACSPAEEDSGERHFAYRYTTRTDNNAILYPYPPVRNTWDIPISIDDPDVRKAAVHAADTEALLRNATQNQADFNAYRYRVARGVRSPTLYTIHRTPDFPVTGGDHFRVVGVERKADDVVDVILCRYYTPGVFREGPDGQLVHIYLLTAPKYSALRVRVEYTKRENGFGEKTGERWLETEIDGHSVLGQEDALCGPFLPDPFIVAPPEPVR